MEPERPKLNAPVICPPHTGAVVLSATETRVAVFVEVMVPPLPAQALRLGDMRSPTIWELPLRSRVAPGPTAIIEPFVPACAPCQRVLFPAFNRTVPPRMEKTLEDVLKYCGVLKMIVPPSPEVRLPEPESAAVMVRSAPELTISAASVVPKASTGAEPAAASVALPMVWEAPVARRLPLEIVSWFPPDAAKIISVPAPSILRALIVRLLRPGLLSASVSAVIL